MRQAQTFRRIKYSFIIGSKYLPGWVSKYLKGNAIIMPLKDQDTIRSDDGKNANSLENLSWPLAKATIKSSICRTNKS